LLILQLLHNQFDHFAHVAFRLLAHLFFNLPRDVKLTTATI